MGKRIKFLILFFVIQISSGFTQSTENWPHWRGPNHNGIIETTKLPTNWSATENIVWKTELPSWSAATPIIWGDQIFVTSPSAAELTTASEEQPSDQNRRRRGRRRDPGGSNVLLLAISKSDGKILWQYQLDDKNEIHNKHNNASPSPVTDGKNIWVVTGTGIVTALDMKGNKIWEKDLQQDFGRFGLQFGYASSPLLYDNSIIIEVLHGFYTDDPSYILSLNAKNGKLEWRQERPTDAENESPDAYTTPFLLDYNNEKQIVISGADYVTGHDPKTGKEIWRAAGLNPYNRDNFRIIGSPIAVDGIIYAPTRKKPLLALKAGGEGDISSSHLLWKWEGSGAPDVPSPISDGKYFYMVDDKGMVTCLDAKKGTVVWGPFRTADGIVSASPVLADGKIYIVNEKAVTSVVSVGAEFKHIATNELDGSYTLASPAISGSKMFIRTSTHLYCIGE
jgi:outer membrane protein assembly factor BamB